MSNPTYRSNVTDTVSSPGVSKTAPLVFFTAEVYSGDRKAYARNWKAHANRWLPRRHHFDVREPFGGHYGVTRSVIMGMRELGERFAYNVSPAKDKPIDTAIVLHGVPALENAIVWKREGLIRRLLAGPNIVVSPLEYDRILVSPEIDEVIVPSEWVRRYYCEEDPRLTPRIQIWPAGTDPFYWRPRFLRHRTRVLVYDKAMPKLTAEVIHFLKERNIPVESIKYGSYTPNEYRKALSRARVCVFLSESESQGLAIQEAWAMNVPTLIYDNRQRTILDAEVMVSTAPYLVPETGEFWRSLDEMLEQVSTCTERPYRPRAWFLQHMTDRLCASRLREIAHT